MTGDNREHVGRIVRDLEAPLSIITLLSGLLDARADGATMQRALGHIKLNVDQMAGIVEELLDISALGRGYVLLHPGAAELRGVVERAIAQAALLHAGRRVVLDAPDRIAVELDEPRIQRVVANLLHRAFAATPREDSVLVKLVRDDDVARLSILHSGSVTETDPVGLFVGRCVVEAHRGRFSAVRDSGFHLELPLN
jgi:signal transduction histidine kinase